MGDLNDVPWSRTTSKFREMGDWRDPRVGRAGHALVNAPTLLVGTPISGSLLAGLVGLAAIAAGPLMCGRKWNLSLIQPVARTSP